MKIVNQNVTDEYSKHPRRMPGHGDYVRLTNDHVIVKFPLEELTGRSYENADEIWPGDDISEMTAGNMNPQIQPSIVYPEILVIVDDASFK